jgi:hypothetical protein
VSRRPAAWCAGAALAALLALPPVWGAALRQLDVSKNSNRYHLVADVYMEAPAEAIFAVLLDYERLNRISSIYKESGYLDPAPDGTPIVYTRVEGCLAFFCRSMRRVERLEAEAPKFIETTALPGESDFVHSRSEWRLEPEGSGTRVTYELEMEPDFWVPPVLGPWFLKRKLRDGSARAVDRIERLAQDVAVARAE